jgi:hypothetical protein
MNNMKYYIGKKFEIKKDNSLNFYFLSQQLISLILDLLYRLETF